MLANIPLSQSFFAYLSLIITAFVSANTGSMKFYVLSSRSVNLQQRSFRFYVSHHVVLICNKEVSGFMFLIT